MYFVDLKFVCLIVTMRAMPAFRFLHLKLKLDCHHPPCGCDRRILSLAPLEVARCTQGALCAWGFQRGKARVWVCLYPPS